jgi:hypothetical protein
VLGAGVLYRDFANEAEFKQVAQYARDVGALLYESAVGGKWLVIVRADGSDTVRAYVVRHFGSGARPPPAS